MRLVILTLFVLSLNILGQSIEDFKIEEYKNPKIEMGVQFKLVSESNEINLVFDNYISGIPKVEEVLIKKTYIAVKIYAGDSGTSEIIKTYEYFIIGLKDKSLLYRGEISNEEYSWELLDNKVIIKYLEENRIKEITPE